MNQRIEGYGEVAVVEYSNSNENGLITKGISIESEYQGTLLKIERNLK